ncbi:hypothetical protein HDV00_009814 [Rhizophlyctis rosea]|nr:hypothetical protein HDV00_009814 [Rhizophlyctis rosea]
MSTAVSVHANSPSIHLGCQYKTTLSNSSQPTFTSLTYTGDIFYGRTGRYVISFFLLNAVLEKGIIGNTYIQALKSLLQTITTTQARSADAVNPPYNRLLKELVVEIDTLIKNYETNGDVTTEGEPISKAVKETVMGDFVTRWMDIQVHLSYIFVSTPKEKMMTEEELEGQREALRTLDAFERSLQ